MKNINIKRITYKVKHQYLNTNNLVLLVALLVAAGWAWGSLNMMSRNYQLQRDLTEKKQQLALTEIDVANKQLSQKYYKTDEFLELSARESLNLAAPGEKLLILKQPSNDVKQKIESEKNNQYGRRQIAKESNIDQWANFLFGGSRRPVNK